jgi:glycosyltransferase involved in cell wall biosynthesis
MVVKIAGSKVIPYMRESRAGRWELDWMQKWVVRLLVLNEGMMEEAVADGFSREQITWMPNPVDMNEFRPAQPGEAAAWRARQKLPADALIVIYVGRLSPEKGLRELLAGFAKAVEETPRAVLTLVGDGPQRAELEALARELKLGPDQVRFVGAVPVEQVPEWLRTSDVFALVSPAEGFSCALLEAMAAGLPPVITDIPANRQLVDPGVQGIAVPVGDTEALGGAFSRLFSDPALRLRLGAAARAKVVENYSTELVVQRYEQLFAELSGTP